MNDTGIEEELRAQLEEAIEQLKEYNSIIQTLSEELIFPIVVSNTTPLTITGVALASGLWKGVYYSPEELKKEAKNMKRALLKIPLLVEHGKTSKYGKRKVGEHLDFYYEPTLESLVFKAKVTDSDAIEDVKRGKLFGTSMKTDMKAVNVGGIVKGFKFMPLENSLTSSPACKKCLIFTKKEAGDRILSLKEYLNNYNVLKSKGGKKMDTITIEPGQVLVLPEDSKELSEGEVLKAEIVTLEQALEDKRTQILQIKPGEYPEEVLDFLWTEEGAKAKYPYYKYYKYPYYKHYKYGKYPKKKKEQETLTVNEAIAILVGGRAGACIAQCMKKSDVMPVTKRMKDCAAKCRKAKKEGEEETSEGEEMSEELAKKPVCPVCKKEFNSFAQFKKHWNQEHAEKYGDYKAAKKLFKSLADKTFKRAFKKLTELAEEEPGEEAKPEESKPEEEKPSEEAKPEAKPEEKPTEEKPGEEKPEEKPAGEVTPAEEEHELTAEELIKKAREAGYKPGELAAEMEIETFKEG